MISVSGQIPSHPAHLGQVETAKKWIAVSLIVVGVTAIVIGAIVQLTLHSLISAWCWDVGVLSNAGSLAAIVSGAVFGSAGILFIISYQRQKADFTKATQHQMREHLEWGVSEKLFRKVWDHSLNTHRIRWTPTTLEDAKVRRIEAALRATMIYSGQGPELNFDRETEVGQMMHFLTRGDGFPSLSRELLKTVLIDRNPEFFDQFLNALKDALVHLSQYPPQNSREGKMYEALVGNLLGIIPFAYPEVGDEFVIPTKINGRWQACHYSIDREIALSPSWFSSSIPAYGLVSSDGGSPLMLFIGTTYPAGKGAMATYFSDFTPGLSVGHAPYLYGRREIANWLEEKEDVHLVGISLGGAMTFHVLRNHREKIGKVQAFNPPGIYSWNWDRVPFDEGAEIQIYGHDGDLVSTLGYFPEGERVRLYTLIAGEGRKNALSAHALIYASHENVTLLKTNVRRENRRKIRLLLTGMHLTLGPIFVGIPLMLIHSTQRVVRGTHHGFAAIARMSLAQCQTIRRQSVLPV